MTDAPNQDLPEDQPYPDNTLPGDDADDNDLAPNQDLPSEKQPPRGKGNNRGKSDQAPGKNKP